jgi:hypothetical protein
LPNPKNSIKKNIAEALKSMPLLTELALVVLSTLMQLSMTLQKNGLKALGDR